MFLIIKKKMCVDNNVRIVLLKGTIKNMFVCAGYIFKVEKYVLINCLAHSKLKIYNILTLTRHKGICILKHVKVFVYAEQIFHQQKGKK